MTTYSLTTLLTWVPLRHLVYHAKSFLIQVRVYTTYYLSIYDSTVAVNDELYNYTTLNTVFLRNSRVLDVLTQPLHTFTHTARE